MQLTLIAADDIRQLADGKILAVGLYADRTVVLQAPAEAIAQMQEVPLAFRLSLLLCVNGLSPGSHTFQVSMQEPEMSTPRALGPVATRPVPEGGSATLILNLDPFLARAAGTFVVHCQVDGSTQLSGEFELRVREIQRVSAPKGPSTQTAV